MKSLLKLNASPAPVRSELHVLTNECGGAWELRPQLMMLDSPAQMKCLGKLYYWHWIVGNDDDRTLSKEILKTNDSVLYPLVRKSLVKQKGRFVILTHLGKRVYELNYYYAKWKKEDAREKLAEQLKKRTRRRLGLQTNVDHEYANKLDEMRKAGAWVNPKPVTEPNAQAPSSYGVVYKNGPPILKRREPSDET